MVQFPHQETPYDPGPEGLKGHQQELTDNLRRGKNPLKPRRPSGPGHRFNILKRIGRALQGK